MITHRGLHKQPPKTICNQIVKIIKTVDQTRVTRCKTIIIKKQLNSYINKKLRTYIYTTTYTHFKLTFNSHITLKHLGINQQKMYKIFKQKKY